MADIAKELAEQVRAAAAAGAALRIVGGDTKASFGRPVFGERLEIAPHAGLLSYEPAELVVTARAGTRLADLEAALAEHRQQLAFEPLIFGEASTIGGAIAAGLSGAARPFAGAARDHILGVKVLDGRGEALRFGGQVIKNVAGFDAFRLMAGAQGLLGAILEVSLRASPAPRATASRSLELPWPKASALVGALMRRPVPLTGAVHDGARLHLRFAGGEGAVASIAAEAGGEETAPKLWEELRKMRLGPLAAPRLWRISIPRTAELAPLEGERLRDWGGAQIWLAGGEDGGAVHAAAKAAGGHASLVRGARPGEAVFSPLPAPLFALHQRLKAALDPKGVFNPGRMYEDL